MDRQHAGAVCHRRTGGKRGKCQDGQTGNKIFMRTEEGLLKKRDTLYRRLPRSNGQMTVNVEKGFGPKLYDHKYGANML